MFHGQGAPIANAAVLAFPSGIRGGAGGGRPAGTLEIVGDYSQGATGSLGVRFGPGISEADRVELSGAATLGGTLALDVDGPHAWGEQAR